MSIQLPYDCDNQVPCPYSHTCFEHDFVLVQPIRTLYQINTLFSLDENYTPKFFFNQKVRFYQRVESRDIGLVWFGYMVFNATSNNISVISWQSVLLVEETGVPGENHRPVASFRDIMLFYIILPNHVILCQYFVIIDIKETPPISFI